mgnify:CR=1 FL=1
MSKAVSTQISAAEYHSMKAVNQTLIKEILRSPAHAHAYLNAGKSPTPAMCLGTAVHASILNPENFDNEVIVQPKINRRTKDGKAQYEKFMQTSGDRAVIKADQAANCVNVTAAVNRNKTAQDLLANTGREETYLWEDDKTGLVCKARIDAIKDKTVIDLKTTADASPNGFARSVAKFGYHIQAAFYIRAASGMRAFDAWKDGWRFNFIAVETNKPYAVACYTLDRTAVLEGERQVDKALGVWAESTLLDTFCGYPDEIKELSLPSWALVDPEEYGLEGVK